MKKKLFPLLFAFALFLFLIPFLGLRADAKWITITGSTQTDQGVFAPGVYDLYVFTNAEEPKYQWFVRVGKGSGASGYLPLEDNGSYSGVYTNHLSLKTHDGLHYTDDGNGWDNLYFSCKVTDKDGSFNYGPDMNMIVFTHESLLKRIKEQEIQLTKTGVANSIASREIGGVKYYDCYLDQPIDFSSSFSTFSDKSLRQRFLDSEGEFRFEYVVTEGTRTTTLTANDTYSPKKAGMGELQVTTNLVLYMDGNRMETIDSRSFVINVLTPNGIGAAYTKTAAALLDSMSFHATTLTNLPKNTYVRLLENKGSFWKVAAESYIGYVSTTALNVMDNITGVSLTIAEPAAYQTPAKTFVLADPDQYEAESKWNQEIWYDQTAKKYLQAGDTFLPNHTYVLQIWLTAKNGKRFYVEGGTPRLLAMVNGQYAECRVAYEQDPEEIIEISYTFTHVHNLTKVNQVNPTCTTPGKQVHYRCSGCGWRFEDHEAKTIITDENWGVIPALGHWESEWKSNGTQHYKVCQRRECAQEIPGSRGKHTGGTPACNSGAICEVCGIAYGAKGTHNWTSEWTYSDETGHAHTCSFLCGSHTAIQPHRPGPEATETTPQVCLDCGYVLKAAGVHTHTLELVEACEPACIFDGNPEYYVCTGCGQTFADAKGVNPIKLEDILIPATGHKASEVWKIDIDSHFHLCAYCLALLDETREDHKYENGSQICSVCGFDHEHPDRIPDENDPTVPTPTEPRPTQSASPTDPKPSGGTPTSAVAVQSGTSLTAWFASLPLFAMILIFVGLILAGLAAAVILIIVIVRVVKGKEKKPAETKEPAEADKTDPGDPS